MKTWIVLLVKVHHLMKKSAKRLPLNHSLTNGNLRPVTKTFQLEIMTDLFSRKPDKTSYNSKKAAGMSKKQSTKRTKSARSEEPDDSKPTTPVGGAKPHGKSKQVIDVDVSNKIEEQEAKSPDSKAKGVRLTSPDDIRSSFSSFQEHNYCN